MLLTLCCFLICLIHRGLAELKKETGTCSIITDSQYYKVGISDKDKALILKLHNDVRQLVADGKKEVKDGKLPPACCLKNMVWDNELAAKALIHAKGCLFDYWNPGCNCGQNFYKKISIKKSNVDTPDWAAAAKVWINKDAVNFLVADRKPFVFRSSSRRFSQMVWQDSTRLGCAAVFFKNVTIVKYPWTALYTCQYSEPGNLPGGIMYYAKGDPECMKQG